jgi:vacuolar-type H+-ATPase subunit I/STV1
MPSPRTLARLDTLAWVLIYAGLLVLVLGIASHGATKIGGWSLSVVGVLAMVAGIVLIAVRSRLRETPPGGAQSSQPPRRPPE